MDYLLDTIALVVSLSVAYSVYFRPAKLIGTFPHIVIWTLSSYKGNLPTGEVASRHITPCFWIGNTGARSILIEDVRLQFITLDKKQFAAYPVNKVPAEAIESPARFQDYGSLGLGGPFLGFSLSNNEKWISSYSFSMEEKYYHKLKGMVIIEVQIAKRKDAKWHTVISDKFDFSSDPIHLHGLTSLSGHPSGALMNHVYSLNWNKRRGQGSLTVIVKDVHVGAD